ncbi:uncharacterized protein LOC114337879 [Diabrotica virgifera virgifera]|uniref:Uncharacterized protein n=1 Tax=Diabrotica virgifera virgifera TaxID=50390 RepID=A0ABM5K2Z6_DIAVI|nr:uncharacterized protein LOC114337879 [Diabrotica virgifera virgifera]
MWLTWCYSSILIFLIKYAISDEEPNVNTISSKLPTDFGSTSEKDITDSTSTGTYPLESVEILCIYIPPGIGNAVKLVWGLKLNDLNLNVTYGVHYGKDDEDFTDPKIRTTDESTLIEHLEFCTRYKFAVSVGDEHKINPNNIRTVVTYLDRKAPPQNLQVDFEPRDTPCLLIKWSAACVNIGQAIGYVVSVFDHETSHYTIVTLPASRRVDFIHHFKAYYGAKFDIKVSTNFPGSKATETVTYKVPNFLQPYKVRISSNQSAGAFMIYWKEPYVPYFIDRLYYEVYIYKGFNTSKNFEKFYVTRPVFIYKGNESEYTFRVGSVSYDHEYRSMLTNPIFADVYGEVHEFES